MSGQGVFILYVGHIFGARVTIVKRILLIIKHIRKLQNTGVHILPKAVIGELSDRLLN